ncbi:MAG: VOC family protein [bacterium]|nr:VOC family protein [bacterium]
MKLRTVKLCHIRQVSLPVIDLERAVTFYRDGLGANFIARFAPPGIAFFADTEGNTLALTEPRPIAAAGAETDSASSSCP